MSDERRIPPLPEDLARGVEQLRSLETPDGFEQRLRLGLADADRAHAARVRRRPPARWTRLLVFVPSLAALAIALHVMISPSTEEEVARFEERHVVLADDADGMVDLDLWVHHHREDAALVHVDAPASVSLHVGDPARDLPPSSCEADRCVHRFVHGEEHTPLRVRIQQPGRYDIHVEHRSPNTRVREHFVVHAR